MALLPVPTAAVIHSDHRATSSRLLYCAGCATKASGVLHVRIRPEADSYTGTGNDLALILQALVMHHSIGRVNIGGFDIVILGESFP